VKDVTIDVERGQLYMREDRDELYPTSSISSQGRRMQRREERERRGEERSGEGEKKSPPNSLSKKRDREKRRLVVCFSGLLRCLISIAMDSIGTNSWKTNKKTISHLMRVEPPPSSA
jgi:hypothetical protein